MIGLFEPVCAPWKVDGIPRTSRSASIPPDWDRMGPYVETAMQPGADRRSRPESASSSAARRASRPTSSRSSARRPSCGTTSWPPASTRSASSPAAGSGGVIAHWIVNGRPDVDVTGINIDRLHPYQANPEYRRTRTVESLGMVYQCHYPTRSMQTARGAKLSPLHDRLAAQGAYFRDVSGWEGADWYAAAGHRARRRAAVVGPPELVSVLAGRARGRPRRA